MQICKFYSKREPSLKGLCCFNLRMAVVVGLALVVALLPLHGIHAQSGNETAAVDEFNYAEKLTRDGYIELGIDQYKRFLQSYPADERAHTAARHIADGYLSLKKWEASISYYEKVAIAYSDSESAKDARYYIAVCFEALGKDLNAAGNYAQFAQLQRNNQKAPEALLKAAVLYLKSGERQKGRKILFQAIDEYPLDEDVNADAHYTLIHDLVENGEYRRAFGMVERFLLGFSNITATPNVWLIKAKLHDELGQYAQALDVYQEIQQNYKTHPIAFQATLAAARLSFKLGDRIGAHRILKEARTSDLPAEKMYTLQITEAKFYLDEHRPAEALNTLTSMKKGIGTLPEVSLLAARIASSLQNYESAISIYELILDRNDLSDSLQAVIHFEAAQTASSLGNGAQALNWLEAITPKAADTALSDNAKVLKAHIYFNNFQDYAQAIRLYTSFLEGASEHPEMDFAQARLARCYEAVKNWQLAKAEWQRLQTNYPASPFYDDAQKHLALIDDYFLIDYTGIASHYIENGTALGANPVMRQAEMYFGFKQYEKALPLLKSTIGSNRESEARALAFYRLGSAYFEIGKKARLLGEKTAGTWLDSARVVLKLVNERYKNSSPASSLNLKRGLIHLYSSPTQSFEYLDALSRLQMNNVDFHEIHLFTLQQHLNAFAAGDSSAGTDLVERASILLNQPDVERSAKFHWILARFALASGDTARSLHHLQIIRENGVLNPTRIRADLELAGIFEAQGNVPEAKELLSGMSQSCFYTSFADTALYRQAEIAYRAGNHEETLQHLQKLKARHLGKWGMGKKPIIAKALLLEGRARESNNDLLGAIATYLDYINTAENIGNLGTVFLALARISEKLPAPTLATHYYNAIIGNYPDQDLQEQALLGLAGLEFDRGNWDAVLVQTGKILSRPVNLENAQEADRLTMIAQLRKGMVQNIDKLLKEVRKKYKGNLELQAEISYEAGDFYIRRKSFKRANKIFKDIRKKYKRTKYGIRGDFGLGKSLLYQNKTEDALEILTEIPQKYPNDPFLRMVYLNLGDFYMAQKQLDNSAEAFRKVVRDSVFDAHHALALRRLSIVYENRGMFEVAIMYTRQLIQTFPGEEETLEMKIRMGRLLRQMRHWEEALALYRQLIKVTSGDDAMEIQYFIGETYFDMGKYEQAIAEYLKLRYLETKTKFPWRMSAVFQAAKCFMRINELEKARELFQFVVKNEGATSRFGGPATKRIAEIDELLAEATAPGKKS